MLAAPTVREAQRAFRDTIDTLGALAGASADDASKMLVTALGVDPFSEKSLTDIGIDAGGGFAMFAEGLQPTIAVHIAAPDLLQHFFDEQRQRGMVTQSVVVDGVEVFTAAIDRHVSASWAVLEKPDPWFLVHFKFDELGDDGVTWLQHARAGGSGWTGAWDAVSSLAGKAAHPALAGFGDLRGIVRAFVTRIPDAVACGQLFEPVQRVSVAFDGDGKHRSARVAFELGDAAAAVKSKLLPPPPGWATAVAGSPIALQWNRDVAALAAWCAPCGRVVGAADAMTALSSPGLRAARVAVRAYDPDSVENDAGAVALDLSDARLITEQLDRIPMRKHLESDRTFGGLAGHSLGVPMFGRIDYVLTDHLAIIAKQDGLLDRIATPSGAATDPPIALLEIAPPAMSSEAWASLIQLGLGSTSMAHAIAEQVKRWRGASIALKIDGTRLVLEGAGDRP